MKIRTPPAALPAMIPISFTVITDILYFFLIHQFLGNLGIQKQNISYGYLFTNLGGQPFGQVPVLLDGHLKLTASFILKTGSSECKNWGQLMGVHMLLLDSKFCKEISENPIHSAPVATKGISVNEPVIWMVLGEVMPDRSVVGWILRDVKGEMKCLRGAPSVSRSFTDLWDEAEALIWYGVLFVYLDYKKFSILPPWLWPMWS